MKQTAVEWLIKQFDTNEFRYGDRTKIIEQAKAMEKEQIMNAWDEIGFEWADSSEEYYNRTYKNTNE